VTLTPHHLLVPWLRKSRSTPPIGRAACTEPQCLCKGAHYLYFTSILQRHHVGPIFVINRDEGHFKMYCIFTVLVSDGVWSGSVEMLLAEGMARDGIFQSLQSKF